MLAYDAIVVCGQNATNGWLSAKEYKWVQHLPVVTSDSGSFRKNSLSKLITRLTSCHLSLPRLNPTGSCTHKRSIVL